MEIRSNQVRIGIDAPPDVRVYREEIYRQILEENQKAAAVSTDTPADLTGIAKAWKDQKPRTLSTMKKHPVDRED